MLDHDQVLPLLLHDDPGVRRQALHYFSDSFSDDPRALPLALDAYERFGGVEDRRAFAEAGRLAMTGDALDRILGLLARTDDGRRGGPLQRVVAEAPGELVRDRWEAIEGCPAIDPDVLRALRSRRDLAESSDERLRDELREIVRRLDADEGGGSEQFSRAEEIVKAMAARDVPDAGSVLDAIVKGGAGGSYMELHMIELAGRRRLREAAPLLVDRLGVDDDFMLETSADALARIDAPGTAALILRAYPRIQDDLRLYAAGLLGRLKRPEAEAALLALLEAETDPDDRVWLCASLCDLFSERAIDAALAEVRKGGELALSELSAPVLALAAVFGAEPAPEFEEFRRLQEHRRASMSRFEGSAGLERFAAPFEGPGRTAIEDDSDSDSDQDYGPSPGGRPIAPIRNEGPRVGRNDPCPCGSGKKFKKCCGRSG